MQQQILEVQACAACGFDASAWSLDDLRRTVGAVSAWMASVEAAAPPSARVGGSRTVAQARLRLPARLEAVEDLVARAHDGVHAIAAAAADLRARGAVPTTATGSVHQVATGGGGVPKAPAGRTAVTTQGLEGDRQAARRHHGAPWQAVSLWSLEVIRRLAGEGHDLVPGAAGENLTVEGLPWADLRPGVRLRAGEALLELSLPAVPCRKLAHLFTDRRFDRLHPDVAAADVRWYAWVVEPGFVAPGDVAALEG